jgi:hypothetical protein
MNWNFLDLNTDSIELCMDSLEDDSGQQVAVSHSNLQANIPIENIEPISVQVPEGDSGGITFFGILTCVLHL